jgi:hypothetical protein
MSIQILSFINESSQMERRLPLGICHVVVCAFFYQAPDDLYFAMPYCSM